MFKVNSRNTGRFAMFKVNNSDNRAMTLFCPGTDRVPQHKFPGNIYLFKVNNEDTKLSQ